MMKLKTLFRCVMAAVMLGFCIQGLAASSFIMWDFHEKEYECAMLAANKAALYIFKGADFGFSARDIAQKFKKNGFNYQLVSFFKPSMAAILVDNRKFLDQILEELKKDDGSLDFEKHPYLKDLPDFKKQQDSDLFSSAKQSTHQSLSVHVVQFVHEKTQQSSVKASSMSASKAPSGSIVKQGKAGGSFFR